MSNNIDTLEAELEKLNERIKDQEARLPAHTIKPIMLIELEELEDERDALEARIAALGKG